MNKELYFNHTPLNEILLKLGPNIDQIRDLFSINKKMEFDAKSR